MLGSTASLNDLRDTRTYFRDELFEDLYLTDLRADRETHGVVLRR